MQIDLEALPGDPETLQQMLREVVPELLAENEKLWLLIQRMLRHRYGPRSEKLDLDQLQLGLEDEGARCRRTRSGNRCGKRSSQNAAHTICQS